MTRKDFLNSISKKTGRTEKEVEKLLEALKIAAGDTLYTGKDVKLPGLGTFSQHIEDERIETNPETGKNYLYPPRSIVTFAVSNSLKTILKERDK